jgi:uncharacterized coiled-coil protein SlyX
MNDVESRVAAIEAKLSTVFDLLHKVADALVSQKERLEAEQARLDAHHILTTAVLRLLESTSPDTFASFMQYLEQTERDLPRDGVNEATVEELRQVLAVLRGETSKMQ